MLKYLVALVAVLCVSDVADACTLGRARGRVRERMVHRERIINRSGSGLFGFGFIGAPAVGVFASPCPTCPAPVVVPPKKDDPKKK